MKDGKKLVDIEKSGRVFALYYKFARNDCNSRENI